MKIGASFTLNFAEELSITEYLTKAKSFGLQVVELVAEPPYCFISDIDQISREKIKLHAQKLEMDLTVHATFSDINIAALNENIRHFAISEIKKCIDFSKDIGSKIVTIHPGDFGALGHYNPELSYKRNFQSIKELTEYAEKMGVIIGLENMPIMPSNQLVDAYSPSKIQEIVDTINSDYLKITWDVGHSHTTNFSFDDFFEAFKDQVIHFHLHDNDGPQDGWCDTHLELHKGTMNWQLFFKQILTLKKDFTMVLELDTWEKISNSIELINKYLN